MDNESGAVTIPLTRGFSCVVSEEDADLAKKRWNYCGYGYAVGSMPGNRNVHLRMHRVILERILGRPLLKNEYCDHINGNRLDNRRGNLRVASPADNSHNMRLTHRNASGYKGVYWHKQRRKWAAMICVNGHRIYLGLFVEILDAAQAYRDAALKYHGEFARFE
jgi:hypothetical protein